MRMGMSPFSTVNAFDEFARGREFRDQQQDRQTRMGVGNAFAEGDYQGAMQAAARGGDVNTAAQLQQFMAQATAAEKAEALQKLQMGAQVSYALLQLPQEQRAQALASRAAQLGMDPAQIAQQDLSDNALITDVRMVLPILEQLKEQSTKVEGFGDTMVATRTDNLTGRASVDPLAQRGPTFAEQTGRMGAVNARDRLSYEMAEDQRVRSDARKEAEMRDRLERDKLAANNQGGNATESERRYALLAQQAVDALSTIETMEAEGYNPVSMGANAARAAREAGAGGNFIERAIGAPVRAVANSGILSDEQTRIYDSNYQGLIDAALRAASGAAVPEQEVTRKMQEFKPQPGDNEAVIRDKARRRRSYIEGLVRAAGRAGGNVQEAPPVEGAQQDGQLGVGQSRQVGNVTIRRVQ